MPMFALAPSMAFVGPEKRLTGVYCREHWSRVGYPLLQSIVHYNVRDVNVEATLTQTFQAETNVEREIFYIFEIPPEAAVNGFSAQVGATKVDAVIKEKLEANRIYQTSVAANVQAFKLDQLNVEGMQKLSFKGRIWFKACRSLPDIAWRSQTSRQNNDPVSNPGACKSPEWLTSYTVQHHIRPRHSERHIRRFDTPYHTVHTRCRPIRGLARRSNHCASANLARC